MRFLTWAKLKTYVISILIALGVGGLSAFLIRKNVYIYSLLRKPPLAPPSIVFPIVWTPLYILMGIGSARIFLQRDAYLDDVFDALLNYVLQLVFNLKIIFNMLVHRTTSHINENRNVCILKKMMGHRKLKINWST